MSWTSGAMMATDEWRPAQVVRIDREIASTEEQERTIQRDLGECQTRLKKLRADRDEAMGQRQSTLDGDGG